MLPTPTGKQLDKSAAAAKYKAIVAPHDKAVTALDDARNQQKPANEVRQLVGTMIKTTDDMLVQLAGVAWPDAVKDSMRVFINALVGNRQAWSNAAHTSYDVDFWLLLDDAIGRCLHDAQGSVSRALGVAYPKSCQAGKV